MKIISEHETMDSLSEFSTTGKITDMESDKNNTGNEIYQPGYWVVLWDNLSKVGLAKSLLRLSTHIALLIFVSGVLWAIPRFYQNYSINMMTGDSALAAAVVTPTAPPMIPAMPAYQSTDQNMVGVTRSTILHTTLPSQPRVEVSKYKVKAGDTLFGVAEKFGLKPETILWGNQVLLGDNPHNIRPDQELNILPVDGAYYRWQAGDGLNGVASFFGVNPETIVNYPGNQLDPQNIGDYSQPNIEAGTWLIIPGGKRAFVTWSAPDIPRDNPGVAKVLGPGACESIPQGAIGAGAFIWPTNNHFLSGYDYTPETNHFGIDIDGDTGDPIYASDSGVVVYSGWNNWGYGNVVVINHGNGWQTLYAHNDSIYVGCGQSIIQGSIIATVGETGNASGSHLHYEMMYNGAKVNPWNYLP